MGLFSGLDCRLFLLLLRTPALAHLAQCCCPSAWLCQYCPRGRVFPPLDEYFEARDGLVSTWPSFTALSSGVWVPEGEVLL